jgi:type 1 glutamine amidotransferase
MQFRVRPTGSDHALVANLQEFDAFDEGYILELSSGTEVLLESRYTGIAPEYVPREWLRDDPRPVMTYAERGLGAVVYLALGHSAGRFGMRPFLDEAPEVRCSWNDSHFQSLLRKGIDWGCGLVS